MKQGSIPSEVEVSLLINGCQSTLLRKQIEFDLINYSRLYRKFTHRLNLKLGSVYSDITSTVLILGIYLGHFANLA